VLKRRSFNAPFSLARPNEQGVDPMREMPLFVPSDFSGDLIHQCLINPGPGVKHIALAFHSDSPERE
jgi:hypothetical protein